MVDLANDKKTQSVLHNQLSGFVLELLQPMTDDTQAISIRPTTVSKDDGNTEYHYNYEKVKLTGHLQEGVIPNSEQDYRNREVTNNKVVLTKYANGSFTLVEGAATSGRKIEFKQDPRTGMILFSDPALDGALLNDINKRKSYTVKVIHADEFINQFTKHLNRMEGQKPENKQEITLPESAPQTPSTPSKFERFFGPPERMV